MCAPSHPNAPLVTGVAISLGVSPIAALYPTWRVVKVVAVEASEKSGSLDTKLASKAGGCWPCPLVQATIS